MDAIYSPPESIAFILFHKFSADYLHFSIFCLEKGKLNAYYIEEKRKEGDHFSSDTVISFIITFVIIRVLNVIFQRFPEDLNLSMLKSPKLFNYSQLSNKDSYFE
jgi:hypothetical protein